MLYLANNKQSSKKLVEVKSHSRSPRGRGKDKWRDSPSTNKQRGGGRRNQKKRVKKQ